MYDWLVVGAGLAGSIIAERLAGQREDKVLLIGQALATFRRMNEHVPKAPANWEPSTAAVSEART